MIRLFSAVSFIGLIVAAPAVARQATAMPGHEHHAPAAPADPHAGHAAPAADDVSQMDHSHMAGMDQGGQGMTGALGPYPMTREASGTAWQPDSSEHAGGHVMRGDWMLMGHATINGVYDWQEGHRSDEKTFVSGMIMGMARRDFANDDAVQLRAMLSPDPLMGKRGYPLLLAAGGDGGRCHAADGPAAPARPLHGAVGDLQP